MVYSGCFFNKRSSHNSGALLIYRNTANMAFLVSDILIYVATLLILEEFIQFLVKVFFVFDRLDKAVLDFNEAVVFNNEATYTYNFCSFCVLIWSILMLLFKHGLFSFLELLKVCLCTIKSDLTYLYLSNFVSFDE